MNTKTSTNVNVLTIDVDTVIKDGMACVMDMVMDDEGRPAICTASATIESVNTPEKMLEHVRAGYTAILFSSLMEAIESCNADKIPFVVVVMKNGNVFAAINGKDCRY